MILQSSLYMFPVSTTPIIRSKQNCNYSLRYCAATSLQRGQASLATLEGGSCTGSVVNNRPTHLLLTTDPVLCEQLRLHLCQLLNLTNHPVQTQYTPVAYRGGVWGVQPPSEIPKAFQNCAKLNPIGENC